MTRWRDLKHKDDTPERRERVAKRIQEAKEGEVSKDTRAVHVLWVVVVVGILTAVALRPNTPTPQDAPGATFATPRVSPQGEAAESPSETTEALETTLADLQAAEKQLKEVGDTMYYFACSAVELELMVQKLANTPEWTWFGHEFKNTLWKLHDCDTTLDGYITAQRGEWKGKR